MNSPVDSHTEHNIDVTASHSRDWAKSFQELEQVKQEQQVKGNYNISRTLELAPVFLLDYNEGQEILKHKDSVDSLVYAVAATGEESMIESTCNANSCLDPGPLDAKSKLCIGHSATSDYIYSPVTEDVTKADKEYFKRMVQLVIL